MKAYGYCRYSSDLQTEASIEQQKSELNEYAKKNDIIITNFYCDEAKTGTKDTREQFQNMIDDCKKKEVQAVLVWKTDRFARNTQDSLFYKMKLEKLGIKLISITQPIDNSTPEGALMYTLLAGMDEYYSKNLASNVKRALKMNAQNCQFNGGIAPLGYDIVNKKYVINEAEAEIVKKIFELYLNGKGILEIASILNQNGYKTKKGKEFGKNSIYDIVGNERYTGTYIFNKGTKHNHDISNEKEIRIENGMPAIISKETYLKAMELRRVNKRANFKKNSNVYILSGLVYCGKCGAKYNGSTSIRKRNEIEYRNGYYQCANRNNVHKCDNHRIKQDALENNIIQNLINKILNGSNFETIVEKIKVEYENLMQASKSEIKPLEKQLKEAKENKENIIDVIAKTGNADLVKQLEKYSAQIEDIEQKIEFYKLNNEVNIPFEKIEETFKADISKLKKRK